MEQDSNNLAKLIWDELRLECCATKLNAQRIVMVHEHDIKKVIKKICKEARIEIINEN